MTEELKAMRIEFLAARAARLGYQLVQTGVFPDRWTLLDAEDSAPIYADLRLADIEQRLTE
ncbi:hypothetical protein [Nocardia vermiculata]|uniref:Uncharacterized protein n=1 Tax=Nocardia vermiculata TaxID=257274 RepID=A0A846Y9N1_9NOCA|nr:hypothetical protein [Nocardia vermiculata]NKY53938.1 hypothetical protein [Nocardia vermiculata]